MVQSIDNTIFPESLDTGYSAITERLLDSVKSSGLLDDDTPGSVLRTLLETHARELATIYRGLSLAHESGYLETAKGTALDLVVDLLGLKRARAGRAVGTVVFRRNSPAPQDIVIPAGLAVTGPELPDGTVVPMFEVVETVTMATGESAVQARVQMQTDGGEQAEAPPSLAPGALSLMPRPLLGIASVQNPAPIVRAGQDESDDELRARARRALRVGEQATFESIEAAIRESGVSEFELHEPEHGPPGELVVRIHDPSFAASPDLQVALRQQIRRTKAAGVRVRIESIRALILRPVIKVTLADSAAVDAAAWERLTAAMTNALAQYVNALGVGAHIQLRKLEGALLAFSELEDAELDLSPGATLVYHAAYGSDGSVDHVLLDLAARPAVSGALWVAEAEKASIAVDQASVAPQFVRLELSNLRFDLSVESAPTDLPLDALKAQIRSTLLTYVDTRPVADEQKTLRSSEILAALSQKTPVTALRGLDLISLGGTEPSVDMLAQADVELDIASNAKLQVGRIDVQIAGQG